MSMFEAHTEESERQRKRREEAENIREFAERRAELLSVQSERSLTDEERLELAEISRQLPMSRAAYNRLVQRYEKAKATARRRRLESQQEVREWKAEVRREAPEGYDITFREEEGMVRAEFTARPYEGVLSERAIEEYYGVNIKDLPSSYRITGVDVSSGMVQLSTSLAPYMARKFGQIEEYVATRQAPAQIETFRTVERFSPYEKRKIAELESHLAGKSYPMWKGPKETVLMSEEEFEEAHGLELEGLPTGSKIIGVRETGVGYEIEAKPPSWKEKTLSGYILSGGEAALTASPLWLELGLEEYAKAPSWEVGVGAVGGATLLYGASQFSAFMSGVVGIFESTASFFEMAGRSVGATILEGKPQLVSSQFITAPPTPISALLSYVRGEEPLPEVPSELAVAYTVGGITGLVGEYYLIKGVQKSVVSPVVSKFSKTFWSSRVGQQLKFGTAAKLYHPIKTQKYLLTQSVKQSDIAISLAKAQLQIKQYLPLFRGTRLDKFLFEHSTLYQRRTGGLAKALIGMPTGAERRVSEFFVMDILGTRGVTGLYTKPYPAVTEGLQTFGLDVISTSAGLKEIFRPLRQEELIGGFTPSAIRESAQVKPLPEGWEQLVTQPASFVKTPFTMTSGYPLKPTELAYMIEHRVTKTVEQAIIGELSWQRYTWTMGAEGKGFFEKPLLPTLQELQAVLQTKPLGPVMKTPLVFTAPEMGEFQLSLPWWIVAGSKEELRLVTEEFLKRYQIPKKGLVVKYADLEEEFGLYSTYVSGLREIELARDQKPKELTKTLLHELGHDYFEMKYPPALKELLETKPFKEEEIAERFEEKLIKRVKREEAVSVLDIILQPRLMPPKELELVVWKKIVRESEITKELFKVLPHVDLFERVKPKKAELPWWMWRGEVYPFTLSISKEWAKTVLQPYPLEKYVAYPTKAEAPTIPDLFLGKVKVKQKQRLTIPVVAPVLKESPILLEIPRVYQPPTYRVDERQRLGVPLLSLLFQPPIEYFDFPPYLPPPPPPPSYPKYPPYSYDMQSELYGGFGALWGQQWWYKQHPILGTGEAAKHIFGASPKHKSPVASYILGGS